VIPELTTPEQRKSAHRAVASPPSSLINQPIVVDGRKLRIKEAHIPSEGEALVGLTDGFGDLALRLAVVEGWDSIAGVFRGRWL
jgi:hypothetical protein